MREIPYFELVEDVQSWLLRQRVVLGEIMWRVLSLSIVLFLACTTSSAEDVFCSGEKCDETTSFYNEMDAHFDNVIAFHRFKSNTQYMSYGFPITGDIQEYLESCTATAFDRKLNCRAGNEIVWKDKAGVLEGKNGAAAAHVTCLDVVLESHEKCVSPFEELFTREARIGKKAREEAD